MIQFRYLIVALVLMMAGCTDDGTKNARDNPNVKQIIVSFTWPKDYGKCFDPKNPEISVLDVPKDTAYFKVKVIDIQNNDYDHGGGKVSNDGKGIIPYGSLLNYQGPCPSQAPTGTGTYEFTVLAYNSKDTLIGNGSSHREFP